MIAFVPQRRGALQRLDHLDYLPFYFRGRRLHRRPGPRSSHPLSRGPASTPAHFTFRGRRLHRRPGGTSESGPPSRSLRNRNASHASSWSPPGRDASPPSVIHILIPTSFTNPSTSNSANPTHNSDTDLQRFLAPQPVSRFFLTAIHLILLRPVHIPCTPSGDIYIGLPCSNETFWAEFISASSCGSAPGDSQLEQPRNS